MKILLATPYQIWSMGRFCKRALVKLGHTVEVFDYRSEAKVLNFNRFYSPCSIPWIRRLVFERANQRLKTKVKEFKPDLLFVLKGELIFPETIEFIRKTWKTPAILWFNDDPHLFHKISKNIALAYDYVFTSSTDAVSWYRKLGVKRVEWIAQACYPEIHKRVELTKKDKEKYKGDICFIGTCCRERADMITILNEFDLKIWGPAWRKYFKKNKYLSWAYGGEGVYLEEMVKIYNARKIALNVHPEVQRFGGLKGNMKVMEITGCGTLLLTDKVKGIEDLFKVDYEIVCYESKEELLRKVKYLLSHPKEREEIAVRGQQRAYKDHTYELRMRRLLSCVERENLI